MMKEFSYKNVMEVPKVQKVVLNVGLGEAIQNIKLLDAAQKELSLITGQKAVVTKAKKSIASFKLRKGVPIGCKVTLRGNRMYEFLDRLISIALPRIRDFKGVSGSLLTGEVTILWVSRNSLYSLRWIMIRSKWFTGLMSQSVLLRERIKKARRFCDI